MAITLQDIIEKRHRRWEERHDIEYDTRLVEAGAIEILSHQETREEVVKRPYLLIESCFQIVDKGGRSVPFFLNDVQRDFIHQLETRTDTRPFYILKGRQQGFTSLITAIQLCYAIVCKNFRGFTLANNSDNARNIFNDKCKVIYDKLPECLKPQEKYNTQRSLLFDKLNSGWQVAVASDNVGRSATLRFLHMSEVAFFECSLANLKKAIVEAVSEDSDPIIVYETTANGFNEAKDLWDSGVCHNLFYEWWRTREYRSTEYQYLENCDSWLAEKIKILKEVGLDKEQMCWYAKKYKSYSIQPAESIKQEYPCTPLEAFISSGNCMFDKERINNRIIELQGLARGRRGYFDYKRTAKPIKNQQGIAVDYTYELSDIQFIEDANGYIEIHREPEVIKNDKEEVIKKAPYSIGGDTAGSGIDYFTAKVKNNLTNERVATLRIQSIDEDLYAEQMYCLGKYYHDAIIGIEINFSRQPMKVLHEKYQYPNLYWREKIEATIGSKERIKELGFNTTRATKPIIINNLVTLMRETPEIENDIETLKEMTTFVKKANGSCEAIDGQHDDLVMATAICDAISSQGQHDWINAVEYKPDFLERNFGYKRHTDVGEANRNFMSWNDF